jgi:hypothetical protein
MHEANQIFGASLARIKDIRKPRAKGAAHVLDLAGSARCFRDSPITMGVPLDVQPAFDI